MNVCIRAKKNIMFPYENGVFFGPVHRVETITPDMIWKLVIEFDEMHLDIDAYQCSIQVIK